MGLVSEQPREIELPELRLVGAMSLVDFRESQDSTVFSETWERFYAKAEALTQARTHAERTWGLNLFPGAFPGDLRWTYGACVEVDTLERDYAPEFVGRYLSAARYYSFEVVGAASEVAPSYDRAWAIVSELHGGTAACRVNLELYAERFLGPENPDSRMDLLFPIPEGGE